MNEISKSQNAKVRKIQQIGATRSPKVSLNRLARLMREPHPAAVVSAGQMLECHLRQAALQKRSTATIQAQLAQFEALILGQPVGV